jgi:hypothetical protein
LNRPRYFRSQLQARVQRIAQGVADEVERDLGQEDRQPVLADLPELASGYGEYIIPLTPLKGKGGRPFRFQYQAVSDEDFLREAEDCAARLDLSRDWLDLISSVEPPKLEPAMTPKKGHIAMQVSGGLLGTNLVSAPAATLHGRRARCWL